MARWLGLSLNVAVLGVFLFSVSDAKAGRKSPEITTQGQSVAERGQAMKELHTRLSASPRPAQRHTVDLSAEEARVLAHLRVDSTGR